MTEEVNRFLSGFQASSHWFPHAQFPTPATSACSLHQFYEWTETEDPEPVGLRNPLIISLGAPTDDTSPTLYPWGDGEVGEFAHEALSHILTAFSHREDWEWAEWAAGKGLSPRHLTLRVPSPLRPHVPYLPKIVGVTITMEVIGINHAYPLE